MEQLEDVLRHGAEHEVCHALMAESHRFEVRAVTYWPHGQALIKFPLQPEDLFFLFKEDPLRTLAAVRGILQTLYAPYVVQEELLRGGDLEVFAAYQKGWRTVHVLARTNPAPPPFKQLCADARSMVNGWRFDVGRGKLISNLTRELIARTTIDKPTWGRLLDKYKPDWLEEADKRYARSL